MKINFRKSFGFIILMVVGYGIFYFSKSWTDLLIYSGATILFSFLLKEIFCIISDARDEISSYEERRKAKYLKQIKPTLTPTEKLFIEAKKDLPYKILKEDFNIFREKMKNRR